MVVRFMSDTPYARLEQEMQHIPGFRPRKSGMIVSHLSDGSKKPGLLVWAYFGRGYPISQADGGIGRGGGCKPICEAHEPFDRHKRVLFFSEMVIENGFS